MTGIFKLKMLLNGEILTYKMQQNLPVSSNSGHKRAAITVRAAPSIGQWPLDIFADFPADLRCKMPLFFHKRPEMCGK